MPQPASLRVAKSGKGLRASLPKSQQQYVSVAMPDYVDPQLCTLVSEPSGSGWVHEVKFDGYRMQARIERGTAVLRSRKGLDWTHRFPEIAAWCASLPDGIIDGEICAVDKNGLPSFSGLQNALSTKKTGALIFYVFDIMFRGREDFRPWALATRKHVLKEILEELGALNVRYVDHHDGDPRGMLRSACELTLEGIVSKKLDAPYVSGRAGKWTKAKCRPRQELVIGGWSMTGTKFHSLMLGARRGGKFAYVGTAGTGFNQSNLAPLMAKLKKLQIPTSPFETASPKRSRDNHWAKPLLVCEVAFETWTRSGKIRQASFKGLREDKDASEVVVEEIADDLS